MITSVWLLADLALLGGVETPPPPPPPPAVVVMAEVPVCWEDEPCWNCDTMGNLICGPVPEPTIVECVGEVVNPMNGELVPTRMQSIQWDHEFNQQIVDDSPLNPNVTCRFVELSQ